MPAGAEASVGVSGAATVAATCGTARGVTAAVATLAGSKASATCSGILACREEGRLDEACSSNGTSDR